LAILLGVGEEVGASGSGAEIENRDEPAGTQIVLHESALRHDDTEFIDRCLILGGDAMNPSASDRPRSVFEKIWHGHLIKTLDDGRDLVFVDRHVLQETSARAFENLKRAGRAVRHPELTVATQGPYRFHRTRTR
jgi:hypothetical protein